MYLTILLHEYKRGETLYGHVTQIKSNIVLFINMLKLAIRLKMSCGSIFKLICSGHIQIIIMRERYQVAVHGSPW